MSLQRHKQYNNELMMHLLVENCTCLSAAFWMTFGYKRTLVVGFRFHRAVAVATFRVWVYMCIDTKHVYHSPKLASAFDQSSPRGEQWAAAMQRLGSLGDLTPKIQPQILSAKHGGNGYHFYSLQYDLTGEGTHNQSENSLRVETLWRDLCWVK